MATFVRRRFNQEVLDYIANPFVAGIFAGDPEQLSVRHALPRLYGAGATHGSVMKAFAGMMRARKREDDGPGERRRDDLVPRPACRSCRTRWRASCTPRSGCGRRSRAPARGPRGGPSAPRSRPTELYDAVIYAAPAHCVDEIDLAFPGGDRLKTLASITHPPVAVLALGFRREDVAHPLDGFGFLVPEVERRNVLGVVFSSTLFAGRAPEGHVLLTAFVGGVRESRPRQRRPADHHRAGSGRSARAARRHRRAHLPRLPPLAQGHPAVRSRPMAGSRTSWTRRSGGTPALRWRDRTAKAWPSARRSRRGRPLPRLGALVRRARRAGERGASDRHPRQRAGALADRARAGPAARGRARHGAGRDPHHRRHGPARPAGADRRLRRCSPGRSTTRCSRAGSIWRCTRSRICRRHCRPGSPSRPWASVRIRGTPSSAAGRSGGATSRTERCSPRAA